MTKKKVFLFSLIGTVVILVLSPSNLYAFCFQQGNCVLLWDVIELINPYTFIVPPIFLFSLITYRLREEAFRAWLHFAYWWVPLSLVMTYLAAGSSGGGFGIPNVFDQEFVALILSGLFLIISLFLIIYRALRSAPTK